MKERGLKLKMKGLKILHTIIHKNLKRRPNDRKVKIVVGLIKLYKRFKTWEKPNKRLGCNGYSCLMGRTDMKIMIIGSLVSEPLIYC
jgi:hypothetical protein